MKAKQVIRFNPRSQDGRSDRWEVWYQSRVIAQASTLKACTDKYPDALISK